MHKTKTSNLQSMNDARDVAQDRQQDVDQEVSTTSALKEDTKRWEDDGENDLADIAIESVSFLLGSKAQVARKVWGNVTSMRPAEAFLPGSERHDG